MNTVGRLTILLLFVAIIFASTSLGFFANKQKAIQAAEITGFSEIIVTEKSWFMVGLRGCGSRDNARFTVKAKNSAGKRVEFYVCTGLSKDGTIVSK